MTIPPQAKAIAAWNPCATCDCGPWCLGRCCIVHTDREHTDNACTADSLCCPRCSERWHPDHPDGVDCAQTVGPLPSLPKASSGLDDSGVVPSDLGVKPEDYADMRIEVVKREVNQGALAGMDRRITTYAAQLVVAALDSFDEEARKAEFRRGFELGVLNERLRLGLPAEDDD